MPKYPPRQTINASRLLVCEGSSDEAFFRALIAARNLPVFSIKVTSDSGGPGGNTGFEGFLRGVPAWPNFYGLQHIVLAADNDTNPVASFTSIQNQITSANPSATPPVAYGLPAQPEVTVPGNPATMTVLMLPAAGIRGNLETLCLQAITHAFPATSVCVDQFAQCTGADAWPLNNLSKMKVTAFLSGQHRDNPSLGLGNVWRDDPALIPLNDPCFDQIAAFLTRF
jgi:hypothetical protein